MNTLQQRIDAFSLLGEDIKHNVNSKIYEDVILKAQKLNPWFEANSIKTQFNNILPWLNKKNLQKSLLQYNLDVLDNDEDKQNQSVGVICAGNIPMVGFHDIMCVLLCGKKLYCKLSSNDDTLIPFLMDRLISFLPSIKNQIVGLSSSKTVKLKDLSAIIATGSNSSAILFENYFKDIPHIIRKSRSSVAILIGEDKIDGIEDDVLLYFGLGCRNISTIFLPEGFDLSVLKSRFAKYSYYLDHNKYRNNYDYYKAIFVMNDVPFKDYPPLILRNSAEIFSPISVLNYAFYDSIEQLNDYLANKKDSLQCIVTGKFPLTEELQKFKVDISYTQCPRFTDFADQTDTIRFLRSL